MPTILSIETATKTCSIALHREAELVGSSELHLANSHSEVLAIQIENLLKSTKYTIADLDAIAVSKGPGSYTGLRIGVSTAKGLAYAQDLPIIGIDTLSAMAYQLKGHFPTSLLVPMLDARRMEVYTQLVTHDLKEIKATHPLILEATSFDAFKEPLIFFGNGASKCKDLFSKQSRIQFIDDITPSAKTVGELAYQKFSNKEFEDIVTFEPFYLKEFYTPKAKNKLK
ncbi:MAG: tRNA (adenosine(37)-N6)-threonylcarbamoyltransferase complex dimerization subunit type 1 TsaB [Cyclobacteriaceae bacterium]